MKAQSRGRVIRQRKVHHPISVQGNGDSVPLTPCTSGRAPEQTGKMSMWAPLRACVRWKGNVSWLFMLCGQSTMTHILYIRCDSSTVHTNSSHLVSALNATVAVQRVRTRQSQLEEAKEEPSVLVTQVLNPDMPLNQSGNNWKGLFIFKIKYSMWKCYHIRNFFLCFFVCVLQEGSVVETAGHGRVLLRDQRWMAPLLPLSVGTSLV